MQPAPRCAALLDVLATRLGGDLRYVEHLTNFRVTLNVGQGQVKVSVEDFSDRGQPLVPTSRTQEATNGT